MFFSQVVMSEPVMYHLNQPSEWPVHPGQKGVPNLTFADPSKQLKNRHTMIAEAAYFKAEKRGFAPGCEERDWTSGATRNLEVMH